MKIKASSILISGLLLGNLLMAQDKSNIKFGKIAPADFDLSKYQYDSAASAIVIADIGNSSFVGNNKGWFSLEFTHYKRVKVLNKNGFDVANVEIPLYVSGANVEKIVNLKAVTYNLENGKIVETRLDGKSVFTDKYDKNHIIQKFTFPAVKEGSIIEFSYTQSSDFLLNLQPWEFQGAYPRLWSEYEVSIPEYFNYVFLSQGYQAYDIKTSNGTNVHFSIREPSSNGGRDEFLNLDGQATDSRWVMKNVPALKEESFTTTLNNHIAKIEFQLSGYRFPNGYSKDVMGNWVTANTKMMEDEEFGADIVRNNGWLDDDTKAVTKGVTSKLEKARKLYAYVRDNFTCTDYNRVYMGNNLKTVLKNKNGSEAEINLLLAAMLNHEGIKADPVILSTREHGYTSEIYPLMDRFNYVICSVNIDTSFYYLDASRPSLGFDHLPYYCYNGHARLISRETPGPVYFESNSLKEAKITSVFIVNDEKGIPSGHVESSLGYYESYAVREKIRKKSKNDFFNTVRSSYPSEILIENTEIDSLNNPEYPIKIAYDFNFKSGMDEDVIYFNPMLTEAYKENPFKAAERKYPVEMPYTFDETYLLNMDVPKGYTVDEIPKSTQVTFNETDGFFEYLVQQNGDNLQLRSRIKMNKADFSPEEYNVLRDFYAYIVKKQGEQIVFKKKK